MRLRAFVVCCVAVLPALCAERGEEIRLWPNGAPGSEGITAAEVSKPSVSPKNSALPGNYTVTHSPSIYVFLPPKEKATGAPVETWTDRLRDWLAERGFSRP